MWVLAVQVNSQPDYPEIDKDPDKSHELFRGPNRNNSSKLEVVLSTNAVKWALHGCVDAECACCLSVLCSLECDDDLFDNQLNKYQVLGTSRLRSQNAHQQSSISLKYIMNAKDCLSKQTSLKLYTLLRAPKGYSKKNWVGVRGQLPKTLTLFMTKICDIPYPIYDLTKNSKPYL